MLQDDMGSTGLGLQAQVTPCVSGQGAPARLLLEG